MKKYFIHIELLNGDEIVANVEAENIALALERVLNLEKFKEFTRNEQKDSFKQIEIKPIDNENEISDDRFDLKKSKSGWICFDKRYKIICEFETKKFNETQKMTMLEDMNEFSTLELAEIMREMGDWIYKTKPEIL